MYFDPGMGSLIIQMVVAALAVVGGYFAAMKIRIKKHFGKKDDKGEMSNNKDDSKSGPDEEL